MQSEYRKMKMLLLFDLPMVESQDVREYNIFIRNIKKIGFYMLQYSVYVKSLTNQSEYERVYSKLSKFMPSKGNIIVIKLTDKQYGDMLYLNGQKNKYDSIVGNKTIVYFGGDEDI